MQIKSTKVFTFVDRIAPYTMVWLSYYRKILPNAHITVLCRNGVQNNIHQLIDKYQLLNIDTIDITIHLRDPTSYIVDTSVFNLYQHEFLKTYDVVVYADIDEFIVHPTLEALLNESSLDCIVTRGLEIVQDIETEGFFKFDVPINNQRAHMVESKWYNKPLIVTRPIEWISGKHNHDQFNNYIEGLYLVHLGRVCSRLFAESWMDTVAMYPNHTNLYGGGEFNQFYIEHFNNRLHNEHPMVEIPLHIKQLLTSIL